MLNRVILRGFVADDPYVRSTEGGKMARLRVATIERVTIPKSGKVVEHTEWHTVALWGEMAEYADTKIRVGAAIETEGALRTRDWEDNAGKKHRTTDILARTIKLLDSIEGYELPRAIAERRQELYPRRAVESKKNYEVKPPAADPDDLPF